MIITLPKFINKNKLNSICKNNNKFLTQYFSNNNNNNINKSTIIYTNINNNNNNNNHFLNINNKNNINNFLNNNNNNNNNFNYSKIFLTTTTTINNNKKLKMEELIKLNFPKSVEEYKKQSEELMETYDKGLKEIIEIPKEKRTFANTFEATDKLDVKFRNIESSLTFLANASTDEKVRDVANEVEATLSKYSIATSMREDLYQAYVDCCKQNNDFKESDLSKEQLRYVSKTLEGFEKNGLQLPKEKREKLKEIMTKISDNSIKFSKNIADDKTKLSFSMEQLNGIPKETIESFEKDESKPGNYFISLKYPDVIPTMKYCTVAETRKAVEFANGSKCIKENTPILEETCKLRFEAAQLLGFKDWASYKSNYLMVKSNDNIQSFEERMRKLLTPHAVTEYDRLKQLKKKIYLEKGGNPETYDDHYYSYDNAFYNNVMLVQDYQVDNNLVKEYFPFEVVIKGIFNCYQELLNVKFTEVPAYQPWHEEVKMYSCVDTADSNKLLGHFYIDLFPREGKYSHAAVWPLIPGYERADGEKQYPVAAMLCNFTKPTSTTPSLLTHDEVVTFFHEFGHVMHNMSTKVHYSMFSGTSVERDFVECPSQLFEFWCWNKDVLVNKLSGHYKDHSKKLPIDLVERMIAAKNLNVAIFYLRQIQLALFDNAIHSGNPANFTNTADLYHRIATDVALNPNQKGTNPGCSFGHLLGGYDAQYYSYLYSECFSASIFEIFDKHGVMNKELGARLRNQVLAVGGSQPSSETIENFLGSKPNEAAFLKTIGL
ncbi:hypothetical protein ACTFIW_006851 [Dictyostelium discoideum]